MLALIAPTACGKDTIKKELLELGFEGVVTTTTRPMRLGEINGVSYHFVDDDEFLDMQLNNELAEHTYYDTVQGRWYYGCQKKDLENHDHKVIILNPDGILSLMKTMNLNDWVVFYIDCPETIMRERLNKRGDKTAEIERRIEADKKDFVNINRLCDFKITNDGKETPRDLARKIMRLYERSISANV